LADKVSVFLGNAQKRQISAIKLRHKLCMQEFKDDLKKDPYEDLSDQFYGSNSFKKKLNF